MAWVFDLIAIIMLCFTLLIYMLGSSKYGCLLPISCLLVSISPPTLITHRRAGIEFGPPRKFLFPPCNNGLDHGKEEW